MRRLLSLGDQAREHAGMVRAIVLSELGYTWTALADVIDALARKRSK